MRKKMPYTFTPSRLTPRASSEQPFKEWGKTPDIEGPIVPPNLDDDEHRDTRLLVRDRVSTERPKMFKVLMLNDDYTPMEFVCTILQQLFGKSEEAAQAIMLQIHNTGIGVCGVYTLEIAETKATQVIDFARKNEHPLQCTVEAD